MLTTIEERTTQIRHQDKLIKIISESRYPETRWLSQVQGVGPITALAYVLTLEDPRRLRNSRQAGSLLGLTPRRDQSGDSDKQLRITKAGNRHLRRLLVGWVKDAPSGIGIRIGVDIGNRFSMYDSDSDAEMSVIFVILCFFSPTRYPGPVATTRQPSISPHQLWLRLAYRIPALGLMFDPQ